MKTAAVEHEVKLLADPGSLEAGDVALDPLDFDPGFLRSRARRAERLSDAVDRAHRPALLREVHGVASGPAAHVERAGRLRPLRSEPLQLRRPLGTLPRRDSQQVQNAIPNVDGGPPSSTADSWTGTYRGRLGRRDRLPAHGHRPRRSVRAIHANPPIATMPSGHAAALTPTQTVCIGLPYRAYN